MRPSMVRPRHPELGRRRTRHQTFYHDEAATGAEPGRQNNGQTPTGSRTRTTVTRPGPVSAVLAAIAVVRRSSGRLAVSAARPAREGS
jgi:hypothetical protein